MIGFEQVMYMTSEGGSGVDVCVTVRNGFTDDSLSVSIAVLPDTTATGIILYVALPPRHCLTLAQTSTATCSLAHMHIASYPWLHVFTLAPSVNRV